MNYDKIVRFRVSAEMRDAIVAAASAEGRTISNWLRLVLEQALTPTVEERDDVSARTDT